MRNKAVTVFGIRPRNRASALRSVLFVVLASYSSVHCANATAEADAAIDRYLGCLDFDCSEHLRALMAFGPDVVLRLVEALKTERCPEQVAGRGPVCPIRLIAALGETRDARAVDALIPALEQPNPLIRAEAVTAIGKIGPPNSVDLLAPLLHDRDPLVREMTALSFQRVADPGATGFLRAALETEQAPHIRQALEKALAASR